MRALSNALRHGGGTPELGRAARTWGAGFAAPVEALSAVVQLREAVMAAPRESTGSTTVSTPAVALVIDQVMMEAVDAASANLRSAARIDSLTGCANRRALEEEIGHALASARRSDLELTLAIVDLDGLKAINDTQGHAAGDVALNELVATLRKVLREADTLYRTGGDEFVVLTPFTDVAGARSLMARAEHMGGPAFSWGVASTSVLRLAGDGEAARDARDAGDGAARGDGAATGSLDGDALALLAAADLDLYARRRARRAAALRNRRKRRVITVASVAASAATVASGAGLAAALAGGWFGPPAQRSGTSQALPRGGGAEVTPPASLGPGVTPGAPPPGTAPQAPPTTGSVPPAAGTPGVAGGLVSAVGSAGLHLVSATTATAAQGAGAALGAVGNAAGVTSPTAPAPPGHGARSEAATLSGHAGTGGGQASPAPPGRGGGRGTGKGPKPKG